MKKSAGKGIDLKSISISVIRRPHLRPNRPEIKGIRSLSSTPALHLQFAELEVQGEIGIQLTPDRSVAPDGLSVLIHDDLLLVWVQQFL